MILPAQLIRARSGILDPFCERTEFEGTSYGLSAAGYDLRIAEDGEIYPNTLILVSTIEHFTMPNDLVGIVHDKSTWARRGLAVQNTVIEPGWRGYLTLELSLHGHQKLRLKRGMGIAQVIFHLLSDPTEEPYRGKYQDQAAGPQVAR